MTDLKYGLIGKSLKHSYSKAFFSEWFTQNGENGTYENLEFDTEKALQNFFAKEIHQYKGLNVTLPYKQSIIPLLDEVDSVAEEIGAVNTIKIEKNRCKGFNTDVAGFRMSIKPFLTNKHERALILGTGGASKAVHFVLKRMGIEVFMISRTDRDKKNTFLYEDMNEQMINTCKLVVNCTPVGMFPNHMDCVEFPFNYLGAEHLVVDLIYNPKKTHFLKFSEQRGATVLNGESMLKHQAMKSWDLWSQ